MALLINCSEEVLYNMVSKSSPTITFIRPETGIIIDLLRLVITPKYTEIPIKEMSIVMINMAASVIAQQLSENHFLDEKKEESQEEGDDE